MNPEAFTKDSGIGTVVKKPLPMQKTWIWSLDWEDPLEEGTATHSSILAWRIPMDRGACWAIVYRVTKSQPWLKQLSPSLSKKQKSSIFFFSLSMISLLTGIFWCFQLLLVPYSLRQRDICRVWAEPQMQLAVGCVSEPDPVCAWGPDQGRGSWWVRPGRWGTESSSRGWQWEGRQHLKWDSKSIAARSRAASDFA